jgi:hypothetical protein
MTPEELNIISSVPFSTMKKYCDNCLRELSKFSFLNHDKKKIYRYNSAMLCRSCFEEISSRSQQLEEES